MKKLVVAAVLFTSTVLVSPALERELGDIPDWGWHLVYVFLAAVLAYWFYSSDPVINWANHSPFNKLSAVAASFLLITMAAVWTFFFRTPSYWPDVQPSKLDVVMRELVSHHEFTITNSSDSPVYAVWIEITGPEHEPHQSVSIEFPISAIDGRRFELIRHLERPPEAIMMTGKNHRGDSAVFLVVRTLLPNSSRTYRLDVVSKIPVPSPMALDFALRVLSASQTPDRFQSGDRSSWMNYRDMPRGLTLHSLDELWMAVLLEKGESQDADLPPATINVEQAKDI